MPAKPLSIGGRYFSRQMDAIEFFKEMLGRYRKGDVVNEFDQVDLLCLIERHVASTEKIGVGVDFFKVEADNYGGRCFWIVRTDGTEVDFSYRRCITLIWD